MLTQRTAASAVSSLALILSGVTVACDDDNPSSAPNDERPSSAMQERDEEKTPPASDESHRPPMPGRRQKFAPSPAYREPPESLLTRPDAARRVARYRRRLERAGRPAAPDRAGCHKAVFPRGKPRAIWGPPTPQIVRARRSGGHVRLSFQFKDMPRSPGCRPAVLEAWVESGNVDAGFPGTSEKPRVRVVAPTGSLLVPLPRRSHPPFKVSVIAFTLDLRRSREISAPVQ